VSALQSSGTIIPGGDVDIKDVRMIVSTSGTPDDPATLARLPVGLDAAGSGIVRLGDVADVTWGQEEQNVFGRFNGEPAAFVTVMMQKGRNVVSVNEAVRTELNGFAKELPAGARIEIGFDQSKNVASRMSHLGRDFLFALLLVLITLSPLGLRASVIVMISIPLCLALGVAALQWCGFGLNQLSIVGCIIALGLLVDDSIVVIENIARFRREGHSALDASRLATKQIFAAVLGTTATLLFAFLPLLMLPEAAGLFIRSLPAAVVFAVLASLVVAVTIVPWLASHFFTGAGPAGGNRVMHGLQRVITGLYRPVLRWCMHNRVTTVAVAIALCLVSLGFIPAVGFSLFPKADIPQFLVEIDAGENAGLTTTDTVARKAEKILRSEPEVESLFTTVGQGNPRVYYNVFQSGRKTSLAAILVGLKSYDTRKTPVLLAKLRNDLDKIPGAHIELKEFQNGPPVFAPLEIRVIGEDMETISQKAGEVEKILRETPGTRNVDNPARAVRSDLMAQLDDDRLAALGLDRAAAQQLVRLVFAGLEVGKVRDIGGVERTIRIRLPQTEHATLEDWNETVIPAVNGRDLLLKELAPMEPRSGPAMIERRGGERVMTISAQVQEGRNIEQVTEDAQGRLRQLKFPSGCRYELGGEVESRVSSFAGFGNAILLAVFGCLAILILEFKTFRGMLIVASVIPLGIIGGLAGLWLAGYSLSFMAMIGFIALIGIEIKNSILLVDFTNQLRAKGVSLDDAVAQAGEVRFLPVVLTTLTALGALVPLALEQSALYSPLAVVIMGGSISSLLLSRLVTPVLYQMLAPEVKAQH
ncbi:MAG: efflux RND transporter permease subunit, partial [Verrucomicrobia bacterium]|nr:efflux RND transporter permease subunit [Verrucomicrobiota bacterium]